MALEVYGDEGSAFAALSGDSAAKVAALKQVATMGEMSAATMAPTVAGLIYDQDDDVVLHACEALAAMGEYGASYADSLADLLNSQQEKRQCFAIGALGMMGPAAAKHALAVKSKLKDSKNPSIRAAAVLAIGSMKEEGMAKDISECLSDKFPSVVNGAITALALLGDAGKQYAPDVAKQLKVDSKEVKTSAVMYFSKYDDLAVKYSDPIVALLKDDQAIVRQSVVNLFSSLKDKASPLVKGASQLLGSTDTGTKAAAALCLGAVGPDADSQAASLAPLLADTDEDTSQQVYCVAGIETRVPAAMKIPCCAAATALASMKNGSYGDDIMAMVDSDSMDIKIAAACALGELGGPYAQGLLPLLEDVRAPVKAAACAALGSLAAKGAPDGDVADTVAGLFDDASPVVRQAVVEALAQMGEEGARYTDAFKETIEMDRSYSVRAAALKAMGCVGVKGQCYASDICRCIYDEEVVIRIVALQTLAELGERGAAFADEVAELVWDQEPEVRAAAIESLGKMGDAAQPYAESIDACKDDPMPAVRLAAETAANTLSGRFGIE